MTKTLLQERVGDFKPHHLREGEMTEPFCKRECEKLQATPTRKAELTAQTHKNRIFRIGILMDLRDGSRHWHWLRRLWRFYELGFRSGSQRQRAFALGIARSDTVCCTA